MSPSAVPVLLAVTSVLLAAVAAVLLRPLPAPVALRATDDARAGHDALVRRLGAGPIRLLGRRADAYRVVVARLLADAGRRGTSPEEFVQTHAGLSVLGTGAAGLTVLALGPLPAALVLVVTVGVSPVRLWREARRRQAAVERALPAFLELMGVLLAAGLTFRHALARIVARSDGPLAEEMQTVLTQLEFGWTPDDALADLLRRSSAPTMKRLVTSARQNLALGVPIATVLSDLAQDVRAEYVVALRIRAQRAVDRASVVLVLMVLPAMLGLAGTILLSEALDVIAELGL